MDGLGVVAGRADILNSQLSSSDSVWLLDSSKTFARIFRTSDCQYMSVFLFGGASSPFRQHRCSKNRQVLSPVSVPCARAAATSEHLSNDPQYSYPSNVWANSRMSVHLASEDGMSCRVIRSFAIVSMVFPVDHRTVSEPNVGRQGA
jgi:hypothetical protein